jgi:hypothetical protein
MTLITDADIVKVDPEVYLLESPAVLKRAKGTDGLVMGTQFAAAMVDFAAVQVAAGHVIQLGSPDGTINGVFEVVEVVDGGTLTVSQVRNNPTDPAIPIAGASGQTWAVKTLTPQIQQAELELSCRLGLKPGKPDAGYALSEVQNVDAVKQVLTALLLTRVFGAMYTSSVMTDVRAVYEKKRMYYEKQAERILSAISLQLPASS